MERVWSKGHLLLHCLWERKLVQPLWKTVWRYLGKLNIELLYHPGVPLLGIYLDKTFLEKDTSTCMFTVALFTTAKSWKQPKFPLTDEWIKKIWYIYTMGYYSATKKNKIMPFAATWMQLEILILMKSERERQIHDISCMWNLKYSTNEPIYRKETNSWT